MTDRLLIVPVEIKARELAAKLLLGALAIARGYSVVIGRGGEIASFARYLPPGVFLEKDVAVGRRDQFKVLSDRGHSLIAWDDEGVVEINYDWYVRYRIDADNLATLKYLFAWGPKQADVIRKYFPDLADRVIEAGNPRMDLLRPIFRGLWEAEAASYRKRFGTYILINTNFGGVNIFSKKTEDYVRLTAERLSLNKEETETFSATIDFSRLIYERFKVLLPVLAKRFSDIAIVLRPHPSEHHDTWRELAREFNNIHVIYEGTAVGWIAGARVLIHNGCTTGLEGVVMGGTPVVAFRPFLSEKYDLALPNDLSIQAFSEEDVVVAVGKALDGTSSIKNINVDNLLNNHISSLQGPLSCDVILDAIDKVTPRHDKRKIFQFPLVYLVKRIYIRIFFIVYHAVNYIRHGNRDAFRPHLFRHEDLDEINKILQQLAAADDRLRGIVVERIFPFCYRLVRKS
jgi:surface carbohydrate biosynthesis protein